MYIERGGGWRCTKREVEVYRERGGGWSHTQREVEGGGVHRERWRVEVYIERGGGWRCT